LWDALNSLGVTDANRTTITASATLLTTQCGILLVDCTAGSVVLTLPTSGTSDGRGGIPHPPHRHDLCKHAHGAARRR
jgi:hypothetical protein